jgi:hypothetical protein
VLDAYLNARADPSAANVDKLVGMLRQLEKNPDRGMFSFAVQALGEFNRNDEVWRWVARTPPQQIANDSYVLFRPALAGFRRDPRFMQLAKQIALTRYWRKTGDWPDFCNETTLPYDCKAEAAKLG